MKNPFTVDLQSFLIERIHNLDFSVASPPFHKTAAEITKLTNLLKSQLPDEALKTLTKLDDTHANQFTIAIEIAYQKGFAEGVKLILYLFENG
jgi:hypothetical protein